MRLLGLDVGNVRIGLAISDELGILASPHGFVRRGPNDRDEIRQVVEKFNIGGLIAGIPRGLSGREGPQAKDVRGWADALADALDLPLTYWDERLTTVIAERSLIERGRSRDERKREVDAVAAAVMLQGYLDSQAMGGRRAY